MLYETRYRRILEYFFQIYDPTTRNRQGGVIGSSYRSVIYYVDDEQKRIALDTIADVDASGLRPGKVVTEVAPAGDFWEAEPEHQNYLDCPSDTHATSSGPSGSCQSGLRPKGALGIEGRHPGCQ